MDGHFGLHLRVSGDGHRRDSYADQARGLAELGGAVICLFGG
jgi:hypothetical protein